MTLRQQLIRSLAETDPPRAVRFDPDARSFEAFGFGRETNLLDPVTETTLDHALAEITERHRFGRGDRLGVRELGGNVDLLHVYAVRQTSTPETYRRRYDNPYATTPLSYKCRLEHICTINLRAIGGDHVELIGNPSLDEIRRERHATRQAQRPAGARFTKGDE